MKILDYIAYSFLAVLGTTVFVAVGFVVYHMILEDGLLWTLFCFWGGFSIVYLMMKGSHDGY